VPDNGHASFNIIKYLEMVKNNVRFVLLRGETTYLLLHLCVSH
jgi:hypothetical protein